MVRSTVTNLGCNRICLVSRARARAALLCAAAAAVTLGLALFLPAAASAAIAPAGVWPASPTLNDPADAAVSLDGEVFVADSLGRRIAVFNAGGGFVRDFDGRDGPGVELVKPVSVAIGPDALVYVADAGSGRVVVFERTGEFVRYIGSQGSAPGQLSSPSGLAFDEAGELYVADTANQRIDVFSVTGALSRTLGGVGGAAAFEGPVGVAVRSGEVFVAESVGNRVQVVTTAGVPIRVLGISGGGSPTNPTVSRYARPAGIDIDPEGNLLVADAGRHLIERCDIWGTVIANWGGIGVLKQPNGVGVSGSGSVYIADTLNDRIAVSSLAGTAITGTWSPTAASSAPGGFSSPSAVAIGPDGTRYVADTANNRVVKFGAGGEYLGTFDHSGSGALSGPSGIAVLPNGTQVFVADTGNNRIAVFSSSGTFVQSLFAGQVSAPQGVSVTEHLFVGVADTGNNRAFLGNVDGVIYYTSGVGQLRLPAGVAADDNGNLYVADTANNRLVFYDGAGKRVRNVGGLGSAPGMFGAPSQVSLVPGGGIVVADRLNGRIEQFTTAGAFVAAYGVQGAGVGEHRDVRGVAALSDGGFVVADTGNHRVVRWGDDATPPTTSILGIADGWSKVPQTVTLRAADTQAGVAQMWYRVGSGSATAYTGPFTIDAQGETQLAAWSQDRAGNTESAKTAWVRIDSIPPTGTLALGDGSGVSPSKTVNALSNVTGASEMRVDQGAGFGSWRPFAPGVALSFSADGTHTVTVQY
ncbi:MAG: hypothetical protein FDZ75_00525, partial [Actinobacteria bacterium]